jgi:hypothetical protein
MTQKVNPQLLLLKTSVERKNHAIPGYQGFIPGNKNQTLLGTRYTEATREALSPSFDNRKQAFSSTG